MTRAELRTLFRSLIDDSGLGAQIFDDARINTLLYEGAQEVYTLLDNNDAGYGQAVATLDILSDATTFAQPTDATRIVKIEWVDGDWDRLMTLIAIEEFANYRHMMGATGNQNTQPVYALRGSEIVYPGIFGKDHTVKITYVKHLEDLTQDTEEWSDIPKFAHRLIAYEAALIGLVAEDSDARQHEQLTNRIRVGLIERIEGRNTPTPDSVTYYPD